ncbi:MAG: restriction endonuclease subunit S [Thermomicrobiales bacterium]
MKRYTVEAGDVCVTIVGANVGDVGVVPSSLGGANLTENAAKLSDVCDECGSLFFLRTRSKLETLAQMKLLAGAAQPKLGLCTRSSLLRSPFPPLETQRQIADILSAYDDSIENNTRRIQILEEMARTIYREWFVHFRYPGHTATPSSTPPSPGAGGWEVVQFIDIADVLSGGNSKTKVSSTGMVIFRSSHQRMRLGSSLRAGH